jgi:hypothetical protein
LVIYRAWRWYGGNKERTSSKERLAWVITRQVEKRKADCLRRVSKVSSRFNVLSYYANEKCW